MVEQEEDIISSGSMESKVEILTAQNLELQVRKSLKLHDMYLINFPFQLTSCVISDSVV